MIPRFYVLCNILINPIVIGARRARSVRILKCNTKYTLCKEVLIKVDVFA